MLQLKEGERKKKEERRKKKTLRVKEVRGGEGREEVHTHSAASPARLVGPLLTCQYYEHGGAR